MAEQALHFDGAETDAPNDYTLKPEHTSVWITVDGLSVYIRRMSGGGVDIEVYAHGQEADGSPLETVAVCERGGF